MRKGSLVIAAVTFLLLVGIFLHQNASGNFSATQPVEPLSAGQASLVAPTSAAVPTPGTPLPLSTRSRPQPTTIREWLHSSTPTDAASLTHGRRLATERREKMRALFRENPGQAMAESLTWSEWLSLPEELKSLVEKPFSAVVDFVLLPHCPPANPLLPRIHPHQILMDGQWRNAYVYGRRTDLTTKDQLPVRGILLDDEVVLADESVEQLSAADAQAVRQLFSTRGTAGICAVTGQSISTGGTTILLGGELYQAASPNEAAAMSQVIASAERSLHPKAVAMTMTAATVAPGTFNVQAADDGILRASATWSETPKNTLAVRIAYADADFAYTLQQLTNLMVNASNTVKTMSYGKTWIVPRIASVTLPKTLDDYQSGGSGLIVSDTRTALTAIGINRDTYNFVVHAHPPMPNVGYAGLGEVPGANTWLNGNQGLEVTVHELGHNYGLLHAHFWSGITGMGNLGRQQGGVQVEMEEYGDVFDIMGGSTLPAGQFNARGKAALNWIEPEEIINVVTNGIYRVYRYDHKDARTNANTKLALRIAAPGGDEYWVSHRRLFTGNASLFRGANIVRSDGPNHQSLIDAVPLSRPSTSFDTDRRTDSGLAVGKTFSDPLGTLRITTIASAGVAPLEYIDVQVVFPDRGAFAFYADANLTTNGLVGSYFNSNFRSRAVQDDWRTAAGLVVAGTRIDRSLSFTANGWGARAPLRLTSGTDANWDNFSVQWDGYIVIERPVRLATTSDDSSRFWIDLNRNNLFSTTAPEYVNNHWGSGQGATRGDLSPIIYPGTYRIRIQYEEGNGDNYFAIGGADIPFDVFVDESATTPGLTGSYVADSLRTTAPAQADWRTTQTIAGQRVDSYPAFTANGWGTLASVGLVAGPNGSNADWNDFSVQWDGFLKVSVPVRMGTISDDHSRMWIDLNTNGTFATTAPEFINNGWGGGGQGMTLGQVSTIIQPGMYRIRIQYEEGTGGNGFLLAGAVQPPTDAITLFNNVTFTGVDNRTTPRLITNDFTIQFWVKSTQLAGGEQSWTDGMGLIDATTPGAPSFGLSLGNGKILFGVRGSDGSDSTIRSEPITDDQWHHVSARRIQASGEITLFVDGLPIAQGLAPTNSIDAASVLTVGSLSNGSQFFIGTIDQVKTWNTARTDEQIAADYHQARNTHGFADLAPAVHIYDRDSSVQVHWDALSSYRILEGAPTPTGPYVRLGTDQNSTNIIKAPNSKRFFRVLR